MLTLDAFALRPECAMFSLTPSDVARYRYGLKGWLAVTSW